MDPGETRKTRPGHSPEDDSDDFTLAQEADSRRSYILRFSAPPDYEDPTDSDTDNVYNITVQVTEGDEN